MYMQTLSFPLVDITSAITLLLLLLQSYHIKIVHIFSQQQYLGVYHFHSKTSFAISVITMGITMHD